MAKKEKEHKLFERAQDWAENAVATAEKNITEDRFNSWSPTGGTSGKKTTAASSAAATKTSTSVSPSATGGASATATTAGVSGGTSATGGTSAEKPTVVNSALASALSGKNENNSPYTSESLWKRLEAIVPGSSAPENRPEGNTQNIRDGIYRYFLPNLGDFGGGTAADMHENLKHSREAANKMGPIGVKTFYDTYDATNSPQAFQQIYAQGASGVPFRKAVSIAWGDISLETAWDAYTAGMREAKAAKIAQPTAYSANASGGASAGKTVSVDPDFTRNFREADTQNQQYYEDWLAENSPAETPETSLTVTAAQEPSQNIEKDFRQADAENQQEYYRSCNYRINNLLSKKDWSGEDRMEAESLLDELKGNKWQNFMLGLTKNSDKYADSGYLNQLGIESVENGDYGKYLLVSDLYNKLYNRYHSGIAAAETGILKGIGATSAVNTAAAGLSKVAGDNIGMQAFNDQVGYLDQLTSDSAAERPNISTAANMAGSLALLVSGGEAAGATLSAIKGVSKLLPIVQSMIINAATFGGAAALQDAGDLATGNMSGASYARDVGVSALSGAAGTLAGGLVSSGITKTLAKYGLQTPFTNWVNKVFSNTAFAAGSMAAAYPLEENKPTGREIVANLSVAFLFSAIVGTVDIIKTTPANKTYIDSALEHMQENYVGITSGEMTAEEIAAKAEEMLRYSQDIRNVISQSSFAGQQKTIEQVIRELNAMDETISGFTQNGKNDILNSNSTTAQAAEGLTEGAGETKFSSLDDYINNPKKFGEATPEQLYKHLQDNGFNPLPLSGGNTKGISFEQGGGFKVNWCGDRILQYHPAGLNHHGGGAYFKVSSGPTGTLHFDLFGNPLPPIRTK